MNTNSTSLLCCVWYFKLTQKCWVLSDFLARDIWSSNHLFYDVQLNWQQLTFYYSFWRSSRADHVLNHLQLYNMNIVHTHAMWNEETILHTGYYKSIKLHIKHLQSQRAPLHSHLVTLVSNTWWSALIGIGDSAAGPWRHRQKFHG
jgi:hypothetical protein